MAARITKGAACSARSNISIGLTSPPAASIDILTPAQIAESLGVTEADVLSTLESGELKGKKIGTSWRVTRAAFDSFLAE